MDTQTHKSYVFLKSDGNADCKNIMFFQLEAKLKKNCQKYAKFAKFGPLCWIFNQLQFSRKKHTTTNRTGIKIFWHFYKNQLTFTTDVALPDYSHCEASRKTLSKTEAPDIKSCRRVSMQYINIAAFTWVAARERVY